MNIKELNDKHFDIASQEGWKYNSFEDEHTNLSIQFAIEVLEELNVIGDVKNYSNGAAWSNLLYFKTEELKKYLENGN